MLKAVLVGDGEAAMTDIVLCPLRGDIEKGREEALADVSCEGFKGN